MATLLDKPISRELSKEQAESLLGFECNRGLVITITQYGVNLKAKGKHGDGTLVPWGKIVDISWDGMGKNQFRKDMR